MKMFQMELKVGCLWIFILGWNVGLMVSGGLASPRFLRWTLRLVKFHTQSPLTIISPNKNLFLSGSPYHPSPLSLPFLHKIRPTHTLKPSSHVPFSLPNTSASTIASLLGSDKTDVKPTSTHMEPTCTEKLLSVINNSDAFVDEFLCSDASMDESLCSDGDVALQRDIQRIIHEHTDNVIKKWGDFEQWVLELRDGRRVAVLIQISFPLGDIVDGVDDSNQLAMVPGLSSESKEIILRQEKGDDVVEDWVSDVYSEDAFQYTKGSLLLFAASNC